MKRPITRDNHYVPQSLLRRWSVDGTTVFARRLLVPHPAVPEWERRSVRAVAYQRDLYTSLMSGDEADEFERWIAAEYEQPANNAIDKVVTGVRLGRDDWHSLARFLALQDLRTPARFVAEMERWERDLPGLINDTVQDALKELARVRSGEAMSERSPRAHGDEFAGLVRISVEHPQRHDDQARLRTDVTLGRALWLTSMRHLLTGVARVLTEHRWTIAEPGDAGEWPLTDHPVLKLNYNDPNRYDFGGGWRRRNVDLMMPLTPRHLLFVEVGRDSGRKATFSVSQTNQLRRYLLERAHRWVFATEPLNWVVRSRPRVVDEDAFHREAELWRRWHRDQSEAERPRSYD